MTRSDRSQNGPLGLAGPDAGDGPDERRARLAMAILGGLAIGVAVLGGSLLAALAVLLAGAAGLSGGLWHAARRSRALNDEIDDARRLRNWIPKECLGRGSMGEVWLAEHRLLPRPAAIKYIRPEALGADDTASTTDAFARFEKEARATALLTSPHTIELYDFGVSPDGTLCYVMEALEGLDLDTLVERHGPLPPSRVVHLLRQVCISLAEAHLQRFVHRDLKPANIYACRKGIEYDFVKVLDFGMVADTRTDEGREVVGTPAYISPEIAMGRDFDHRADIYSLGCVAYRLLTGRNVFEAENVSDVISMHLRARPTAPSTVAEQEISRDLDLVVLDCLHKDPRERIKSAVHLSKRLATCEVEGRWTPGRAMAWWKKLERDEERGQPVVDVGVAAPAATTEASARTVRLRGEATFRTSR